MSPIVDHVPDLTFKYIDDGRYQLLKRLGAGSYGVVYRARERLPRSGRYVTRAIKVVPLLRSSKRFHVREILLHSSVPQHPNVVTLHRAFREGVFVFIIMDFLDGGDLHTHVNRKRTLCRNDALIRNIFLQIIDGVEACHNAGVYHRDLKPENILVNSDLTRVCVGDFGLSTNSTESTSFNTGSRYYMSPECIDCGDELYPYDTRRTDIWALGIILLNMVTGYVPWQKATLADAQFKQFLEDEERLRQIFPISKGLNNILRRVFTIVPSDSLSLTDLRREVRNLDTFYMSEEDRRSAGDDVEYMWKWYAPHVTATCSSESSNSEGGFDSWTSSESSNSMEDDSDDSDESEVHLPATCTNVLIRAEEGRILTPHPYASRPNNPEPSARPCLSKTSSDEFPIRRPATRRAQIPPPSYASSNTSDSSEAPITPETHAQNAPYVAVTGPMEPLILDAPVLCHGKESIKDKRSGALGTLSGLVRSFVSSQRG
ncbi:kinase-like domain-containing protein [Trametes punicea]|nr:kinase-like domain-containing protein [Trametes punicea]